MCCKSSQLLKPYYDPSALKGAFKNYVLRSSSLKTIIFDGKNLTDFEDHVKSQNSYWKGLIRFIETKIYVKIYIGSFEQLNVNKIRPTLSFQVYKL